MRRVCPKCTIGNLRVKRGWYECDWCDYEITIEVYRFCKENGLDPKKFGK